MHERNNRAGIIMFLIVVLVAGGIVAYALTHRPAVTTALPSATHPAASTTPPIPAHPAQ